MKQVISKILVYSQLLLLIEAYMFKDKGKSYIQFEQWDASERGTMSFKFKTHSPNGLLMYSDNSGSRTSLPSLILLKLEQGKLFVTVQMGSEDYRSKRSGAIGNDLDDLEWHHVLVKRDGRQTTITLDQNSDKSIALINDGELGKLELNSGLFFGGVSSKLAETLIDRTILAIPR